MWFFAKKSLHKSCRMDRCIVVMKRIWSLSHYECDGHIVHKLSQWRLTAKWLAPRESDCSWMHSKVSCDWLASYIKATRPVLEIFKKDGYFLDSLRTFLDSVSFHFTEPHKDTPTLTQWWCLCSQIILRTMLALALLLVEPPMPDRSKVMTQTKRCTLVLQVGGWAWG